MIIWINGTFGVGKTTTAGALVERDPRLRLFDPEWVGYLLMNNLADHDVSDFQQFSSWRRLTPLVADELARFTDQSLVAVQTILDEAYWLELAAGLEALGHSIFHVIVEADESVTRQRILADEHERNAARWRLDHLATYPHARPWLIDRADLVVDTTALTADEAAGKVWAAAADKTDQA